MGMKAIQGARRGALALTGALLAVAAGFALLIGGVGGAAASPNAAAKSARVTIKSFKYHPKPLRISKGTRVGFTNKDRARHTATHRGIFNTGVIKHNQTRFITFRHKGTFRFHCTLHPFMKGTVIVH
jgi:plastocyanin